MRILLTLLFFNFSLLSNAQTADEVVQRYINFGGGEINWKKITTIVSNGEYDYGGVVFPFTAYSKAPNLYKFIVPFKGKFYAQAYDGKGGWKIDAFKNEMKATLLEGKAALAMANEADVELESPFIDFKKKGHKIRLEGKETIENKSYFKLILVKKGGDIETYFFDTTTYALFLKTAISKNTELEGVLLHTYFSDYRKVGNLTLPFKLLTKTGDQPVLTVTIKEIQLNTEIKEEEFIPMSKN